MEKPIIISVLENEIGKSIHLEDDLVSLIKNRSNSYVLDEEDNVVGLSIIGVSFKNTDLLNQLQNLRVLIIKRCRLGSAHPIGILLNLITLEVENSNLIDISFLKNLVNLRRLSLRSNQIVDIYPLFYLTKLKSLSLGSNKIKELKSLEDLINIEDLELSLNEIENLTFLKNLTNVKYLSLYGNIIEDLRPIVSLINLKILHLGDNRIYNLDPIAQLKELTHLGLQSNFFHSLQVLENNVKLEFLDIRHNNISNIMPLVYLNKLKILDISDNPIEDLSPISRLFQLVQLSLRNIEIVNCEAIGRLNRIRKLFLSHNFIEDISFLSDCTNLEYLNLDDNQIYDIAPLWTLKKLRRLSLNDNSIFEISSLSNLTNLTDLSLRSNNISNIEAIENLTNLSRLNLSYNTIVDINPLGNLSKLKQLNIGSNLIQDLRGIQNHLEKSLHRKLTIKLGNNPLEYPPKDIVVKGNEFILGWFKEIDIYGEEPLYEAKLLIVGEPNAGKTSLRKKLVDPSYEIEEGKIEETIGVYIHEGYNFPYYKNPASEISTYIWDFGGQDKQYPLHQYFLKDKSVYALLSLDRSDNQYLDKWFSIIRLLSGNESEVILVLNQKNRSSQSSNFNRDKYIRQGFKFKEHILDLSKDQERFCELQNNIRQTLSDLPHIGEKYPKYCKTIAIKIDEKRYGEGKDYLTYEEYENLCNDLNLTNDDVPQKALLYLDIIGKVVHYRDDCNLERIIILNPHWLIDAIYGVLTCEELDEYHRKGRFTREWLTSFLKIPTDRKPNGYKESETQHILNLMLKNHFDICYETKGEFLIPLCMPENLPNSAFPLINITQVIFKYEVMPSGMVARVLVRLNEYIDNDNISRVAGILKSVDCLAKIEEYYIPNDANRYIRIAVSGEQRERKEFLNKIREELVKVQKDWFEKLEVNELIPCICAECKIDSNPYLFETKNLKKALEKNKFNSECKRSHDDVNIFELFGEIYDIKVPHKINSEADLFDIVQQIPANKQIIFNIMGDQFNFRDNASFKESLLGSNSNYYHNRYKQNDDVEEFKAILNDFIEHSSNRDELWFNMLKESLSEIERLELAISESDQKKSVSKIRKIFNDFKDAKDVVAILGIPADIATKGEKLLDIAKSLFN